MYGTVGGGFWSEGFDESDVKYALNSIKTPLVNIHLNSNGGDVFSGIAIGHLFKNSDKTIHVYNDAMVASAATIIAMGADKIFAPRNTMMMVHRASTFMMGHASDLRNMADDLDKVDESLVQSYLNRFNGSRSELENLLDGKGDGTFLTAEESVAYGFADELLDPIVEDNEEDEELIENKQQETFRNKRVNRFAAMLDSFNKPK